MLRTRARATQELQANKFGGAIEVINQGLDQLREFYDRYGRHDLLDQSPEIISIQQWLDEINKQRPLSRRETAGAGPAGRSGPTRRLREGGAGARRAAESGGFGVTAPLSLGRGHGHRNAAPAHTHKRPIPRRGDSRPLPEGEG